MRRRCPAAVLERMARPFSTGTDLDLERRADVVANLVRIAFGLLLCHRQLDMAGFAMLDARPVRFALRCLVEGGLAAAVALGIATPLALAALLLLLTVAATADSLGIQLARILCWGLLLAGAGRCWSVDSHISASAVPRAAAAVRALYRLAVPRGRLGLVRLLLVALYWALTLSGVTFHAFDAFWLRGQALQVAFAMPYMSEHYSFFAAFLRRQPALYDLACRVALYVQVFWQLGLLPLFYLPGAAARAFAILQGAGFFLASAVLFNLGYLGLLELCLWVLVFGSLPRAGLRHRARPEPPPARGVTRVIGIGVLAAATSVALSLVGVVPGLARFERLARGAGRPLFKIFGLVPVNVFNRPDLELGAIYLVVLETDDDGRPIRTVPFLDRFGGRLDYLRNDYLYFSLSLPWQRSPPDLRFEDARLERPSQRTLELLRRIVDLDACLTRAPTPRHYRAEILARPLVEGDRFSVWSEPRHAATIRLSLEESSSRAVGCYDLPPGHLASARRAADTLAWARRTAAR